MHSAPGMEFDVIPQSRAIYLSYRDENRVFADIGLWQPTQVAVRGLDEPEQVNALRVTEEVRPLIGVRPAIGRAFGAADVALTTGGRTVILSHSFWQRRFGGIVAVLGRSVRINGVPSDRAAAPNP